MNNTINNRIYKALIIARLYKLKYFTMSGYVQQYFQAQILSYILTLHHQA